MSETRATSNVLQLRLTHIFAFTFAVALVLSIPIAIAIARGTYQQAIASLQPQTAVLFVFDAIVKAGGVCGLFALAIHRYKGLAFPTHPAEYLWVLLGAVVASQLIRGLLVYSLDDIVNFIGGITAAWLCRDTRWKWFYLLVAFPQA